MSIEKIVSDYNLTLLRLQEILPKRKPITLKKGEPFIEYGERAQKMGLLLEGLLVANYVSETGEEWISRFFYTPANSIISNHESFMLGEKSSETIRAYEDSTLLVIEKAEYEELLTKDSRFAQLARILAEESYIQAMRRVHSFQSLNALQRVKKFISEHRELLQKVQKQHIASYLGIHRNIFTKILRKL
jgi:CRP-like cAMP-binding protein